MNFIQEQDRTTRSADNDYTSIVASLARSSKFDYDRLRKQAAKDLGIQVKTLDELVKEAKHSQAKNSSLFQDIEPWHKSIDLDELLDELVNIFQRFVILPEHLDVAISLWVCFTWCIDSANTAPILTVSSPEKRCGKTTVLSLLNLLVKRSLSTSNVTPAALFRTIEEHKPTLLIDEADTFIKQSDDLRGILNSGHTRSTAFVLRTVGENHTPKAFNTWGAKAIALIGKLPDTLHDRSIIIPLKRKLTHEKTEKLYRSDYNFEQVRQKLARFALDYAQTIKHTIPPVLPNISDRAADNWESLLAIATQAGKSWQDRAIKAILAADSSKETNTYGTTLLSDIKEIFERKNINKIFSSDLITELCHDKEKPWATFRHGNPIDQSVLANLLKEFSVISKSIRINSQNLKGYELAQFADSFARYIPNTSISIAAQANKTTTDDQTHISLPLQNILENLSATLHTRNINNCKSVMNNTLQNDCATDEYLLEERAAIMQYDGGLSRAEAKLAVWGRVVSQGKISYLN